MSNLPRNTHEREIINIRQIQADIKRVIEAEQNKQSSEDSAIEPLPFDAIADEDKPCPKCDGEGVVPVPHRKPYGKIQLADIDMRPCPKCRGGQR